MSRSTNGVSALKRVEAILRNPALYELSAMIPAAPRQHGGRKRIYPDYMLLVYEALISIYRSARQVEAELSHRTVWKFMRKIVKETFPQDQSMWLPSTPMKRHHYVYGRNRYLADPAVFAGMSEIHRTVAAQTAREVGLLDPNGPGSWTHPSLTRMLYADGKVITPLFKAKPGDKRVDKRTGEVTQLRHEPDAGLHYEGGGEMAYGTKFVIVAVRSEDERGRVILDVDWVPKPGAEANVAMKCFERLSPGLPGAQGVIYDTALRGIHHQKLLRELGLIPVNKVTAAESAAKRARKAKAVRVEKSIHFEDREVTRPDGMTETVRLYAFGGAIGIAVLTDRGALAFQELDRIRTHRNQAKNGLFRWYNDYRLPEKYGGGVMTIRLHGDQEDVKRGFNRPENVRPIPPTDPDFDPIYARRNDAESINRAVDDSMWLSRAHSIGHLHQLVNLLGYALMVNGLTLLEHCKKRAVKRAAA